MTEIFTNVREEIKSLAEEGWKTALKQGDPISVADALNKIVTCFSSICSEEEIEFLQFYFKMQMEMMKE